MARPVNTKLRLEILDKYRELRKTHPFAADLIEVLAIEFQISPRSVKYYISSVGDRKHDARKRYTDEERAMIKTMNRANLMEWARQTGRNPNTVYALQLRLKKEVVPNPIGPERRKAAAEERGYFDFSDRDDLRAFSLPMDSLVTASVKIAKALPKDSTISLIGPNFLYHNPTKRHYCLDVAEQLSILTDPIRFLRFRSAEISKGWQGGATVEYHITASDGQSKLTLGVAASLDEVARIQRWFGRNLPYTQVSVDLYTGGTFQALRSQPLPRIETETEPSRSEDTGPYAAAPIIQSLDDLDAITPKKKSEAPALFTPRSREEDAIALTPAPKVFVDATRAGAEAPLVPTWTIYYSAQKEPVTLSAQTADDAAYYFTAKAQLEADTVEELINEVTAQGEWLVMKDAAGSWIAATPNAPETI